MSVLGRRKHSRFFLAQPVEGRLRVREDVAIEEWSDTEVVILSPEPGRADEHLTIEVSGATRRRLSVRILESRPAADADGAIRHRLKLSIEHRGEDGSEQGGRES